MQDISISVVIPTYNRHPEVIKCVSIIRKQLDDNDEIIVVDSSNIPVVIKESVVIHYNGQLRGASIQRNIGIARAKNEIVLCFDDDQELSSNGIALLKKFLSNNDQWSLLQLREIKEKNTSIIKSYLQSLVPSTLYPKNDGYVALSGWHRRHAYPSETNQWMSTNALVLRKSEFSGFDESLVKYSYLEDLFFSYPICKNGICRTLNIPFNHYPAEGGRISQDEFGLIEVLNRRKFVHKHGLSKKAFSIMISLRFLKSLLTGQIARARGNLIGFLND